MTSDVIKRRLAAILSTDVVGYSRLMGDDEEGTFDMLRQCRQTIDGCIAEKGGVIEACCEGAAPPVPQQFSPTKRDNQLTLSIV